MIIPCYNKKSGRRKHDKINRKKYKGNHTLPPNSKYIPIHRQKSAPSRTCSICNTHRHGPRSNNQKQNTLHGRSKIHLQKNPTIRRNSPRIRTRFRSSIKNRKRITTNHPINHIKLTISSIHSQQNRPHQRPHSNTNRSRLINLWRIRHSSRRTSNRCRRRRNRPSHISNILF